MKPQPELVRALTGNAASLEGQARVLRLSLRWLRVIGFCLIVLTIIALGVILSATRTVTMPVVAGIVAGLIIGPLGDRARARGIPPVLTFSVAVLALVALGAVIGAAIMPALGGLSEALPLLRQRVMTLSTEMGGWAGGLRLMLTPKAPLEQATLLDWAGKVLAYLTPALSQMLVFLFALILFLAGRSGIRQSLTLAFQGRENRLAMLRTFSNVENRLTDYFVTVSAINAGLGLAVGVLFALMGVPAPERWGLLVFMLNFLPVVGPLLIKAALLVYALLFAPSLLAGLAPVAAFLVLSLVEANLVTPRIVGARMTMSPLLVFISVIFWTWLWGFAGAFLAMPFLAIASAVLAERGTRKGPQLPG